MGGTAEHFPSIGGLAGHAADHDYPGVHPDPHAEADEAAVRQRKLCSLIAATTASEARTARSGSFSWAAERRNRPAIRRRSAWRYGRHSGGSLVADIAVGSDDRENLGIDPLTQGCRADDVDKCHGELPAFGVQSFAAAIRQRHVGSRSARLSGCSRWLPFQFPPYLPRRKIVRKAHRLMLPSGLACRQFHGLNAMCWQPYCRSGARVSASELRYFPAVRFGPARRSTAETHPRHRPRWRRGAPGWRNRIRCHRQAWPGPDRSPSRLEESSPILARIVSTTGRSCSGGPPVQQRNAQPCPRRTRRATCYGRWR